MAKKKSKASKKKSARAVKKTAGKKRKKMTARKAARPAKRAAKKSVKKAARKVAKKTAAQAPKKRAVAVAKPKPAPKPPQEIRPAAVAPFVPALTPAAPAGAAGAAPAGAAGAAPAEPAHAEPPARGPRMFEPDDQPSAARPASTGPFYENDRRDRPFYDSEGSRTALDEDAEVEEGVGDSREEEIEEESGLGEEEEDDDDDPRRATLTRAPPAGPRAEVGSVAPEFSLRDETGRRHALADYRGRKVVLYFYPKDDTPGCTREACGFREVLGDFDDRNAVVLGISPDPPESHAAFARKYSLTFPLLCDENHAVAERYGVWGERTPPNGRKKIGILRATFIINEGGRIAKVFRNVQPDGHEHQVLSWLDQNWLASD